MRVVVLLALVGCNSLYGIEETSVDDDNDVFGPGRCPAPGEGAPGYRRSVTEIITRDCFDYTTSERGEIATAMCNDRGSPTLEQGPIEGDLEPATVTASVPGAFLSGPRLVPEGTHVILKQIDQGTSPSSQHVSLYLRQGSAWSFVEDIFIESAFLSFGTPSQAPDRRIMVSNLTTLRELAEGATGWSVITTQTWESLTGSTQVGDAPHLSFDGLRLTFSTSAGLWYAVRTSLGEPFATAERVTSVGDVRSPFMSDDCGTLYFTGLSSVFRRYQE